MAITFSRQILTLLHALALLDVKKILFSQSLFSLNLKVSIKAKFEKTQEGCNLFPDQFSGPMNEHNSL